MSIKIMTEVWESSLSKNSARLVMLALADWADDQGYCYPLVPSIAEKCLLSERAVQGILQDQVAAGELVIEARPGRGKASGYYVLPPASLKRLQHHAERVKNLHLLAVLEKAKSATGKGEKRDTKGVKYAAVNGAVCSDETGDEAAPGAAPAAPNRQEPSVEPSEEPLSVHVTGKDGETNEARTPTPKTAAPKRQGAPRGGAADAALKAPKAPEVSDTRAGRGGDDPAEGSRKVPAARPLFGSTRELLMAVFGEVLDERYLRAVVPANVRRAEWPEVPLERAVTLLRQAQQDAGVLDGKVTLQTALRRLLDGEVRDAAPPAVTSAGAAPGGAAPPELAVGAAVRYKGARYRVHQLLDGHIELMDAEGATSRVSRANPTDVAAIRPVGEGAAERGRAVAGGELPVPVPGERWASRVSRDEIVTVEGVMGERVYLHNGRDYTLVYFRGVFERVQA